MFSFGPIFCIEINGFQKHTDRLHKDRLHKDRLHKEKKLRLRVERDLEELQESSSHESSDDDTESEWVDNRKKKPRKYENGEKSKSRSDERVRQNGGNLSRTDVTRRDRPSSKRQPLAKSTQSPLSPDDNDSENQELESESQTDGESRKVATNPGLQMAYEFLSKYGKDSDEENSGFSSKVPLGLNKKSVDNKREGKQQGMDLGISCGVCYKFQRSGECTRRDCRYKHIYPEASYPNYSFKNSPDGVEGYQGRKNDVCNEFERTGACTRSNCKYMHCSYSFRKERSFSHHRQIPGKTACNLRPTSNRRERTGQRRSNICYKYRDVGYCPFGSRCKFDHIDQSSFNQYSLHNESKSEHYFLDEMKSMLNIMKRIVEIQQQPIQVPIVPSINGNQHQQFMPNQGQQVWPVIMQQ